MWFVAIINIVLRRKRVFFIGCLHSGTFGILLDNQRPKVLIAGPLITNGTHSIVARDREIKGRTQGAGMRQFTGFHPFLQSTEGGMFAKPAKHLQILSGDVGMVFEMFHQPTVYLDFANVYRCL